jgi:hypothetical protein
MTAVVARLDVANVGAVRALDHQGPKPRFEAAEKWDMKDRSVVDFMCGAVACLSVLGFYAMVREYEAAMTERRQVARKVTDPPKADERFSLGPGTRKRRRRSVEDDCRHCAGSGQCQECLPAPCRVCRGRGLQPRDESLIVRLNQLWGAA